MGTVKQLLAFGQTTVLGEVIENAAGSMLDEIILVLGHAAEQIRETAKRDGVRVVTNEDHGRGQSTSLRAGLTHVSEDSDAVMFILGDQPLVGPGVMNALIDGYYRTRAAIVLPTYRAERGNPVVVDRSLFPRIECLEGDMGARALFEEYREAIVEVEVPDDSIHMDMDTWEDYERLLDRAESR
jgi:molybdenum cofactor cytidylyltransferase